MTSFWKIDRFRANRAHVAARKQATRRSAFEPREAALALADSTASAAKRAALVSREAIAETRRVCNIEVEGAHTYFVGDDGGVLAHNACNECGAAWYNVGHAIFGCPVANARNHEKMQNLGLTAFSAVDEVQTHENAEWAEEATIELASTLPGTFELSNAVTVTDSSQPLPPRLCSAAILSAPVLLPFFSSFVRGVNASRPVEHYSYLAADKVVVDNGMFLSTTGRVYMSKHAPGAWLTKKGFWGGFNRLLKTGKYKPLNDKEFFIIQNTVLFKPCPWLSIAGWKRIGGQYYTNIGISGFNVIGKATINFGGVGSMTKYIMGNGAISSSGWKKSKGELLLFLKESFPLGAPWFMGNWDGSISMAIMFFGKTNGPSINRP